MLAQTPSVLSHISTFFKKAAQVVGEVLEAAYEDEYGSRAKHGAKPVSRPN